MDKNAITILCLAADYIYRDVAASVKGEFPNAEILRAHNHNTAIAHLAEHGHRITALVAVSSFSNAEETMSLNAGFGLAKYVGENHPSMGVIVVDMDCKRERLEKIGALVVDYRPFRGDLIVSHIQTIMERAQRPLALHVPDIGKPAVA